MNWISHSTGQLHCGSYISAQVGTNSTHHNFSQRLAVNFTLSGNLDKVLDLPNRLSLYITIPFLQNIYTVFLLQHSMHHSQMAQEMITYNLLLQCAWTSRCNVNAYFQWLVRLVQWMLRYGMILSTGHIHITWSHVYSQEVLKSVWNLRVSPYVNN